MMRLTRHGRRRCPWQHADTPVASLNSLVLDQVALLQAGRLEEACSRFLADYGVIYSNGALVGEGQPACLEQLANFVNSTTNLKGQVTDLYIDDESEFCAFRSAMSFRDKNDAATQVDSLHVQMWADGKIASEWGYTGEPMMQMITRGVLDDPAHILELIS